MLQRIVRSSWLPVLPLIIAVVTFATAFGQQTQRVANIEQNLVLNYVPRAEYQTLYTQHMMMMESLTNITRNNKALDAKLDVLIQQEARLHGRRFQVIPPPPVTYPFHKVPPDFPSAAKLRLLHLQGAPCEYQK